MGIIIIKIFSMVSEKHLNQTNVESNFLDLSSRNGKRRRKRRSFPAIKDPQ